MEMGIGISPAVKDVTVQSHKEETPPSPTLLPKKSLLVPAKKPTPKSYFDLIKDAIVALAEPKGSSRQAIKKHVSSKKKDLKNHQLNKAIATGITNRKLVQVKGCYKLSAALLSKALAKNPAPKTSTPSERAKKAGTVATKDTPQKATPKPPPAFNMVGKSLSTTAPWKSGRINEGQCPKKGLTCTNLGWKKGYKNSLCISCKKQAGLAASPASSRWNSDDDDDEDENSRWNSDDGEDNDEAPAAKKVKQQSAPSKRSSREIKSRFVSVGGDMVLKENMYTLEEGIQTISGSGLNKIRHELPKVVGARTAFTFFTMKLKREQPSDAPALSLPDAMRIFGEQWQATPAHERAAYEQMAAKDKARFEKESRQREVEEQRLLAISRERERREDTEQRELAEEKRRRKVEKSKQQKRASSSSTSTAKKMPSFFNQDTLNRQIHNKGIKLDFEVRLLRRNAYLKQNLSALQPFVSKKVLSMVRGAKLDEAVQAASFQSQPKCIRGGTMRDYQLRGLEFLVSMHDRGCSAILADEMGLGKTLQTIAFLSYLKFERKLSGPSLVICPLSVLSSWSKEFKRWCPQMRIVRLHSADMEERERLKRQVINDVSSFDVVITTYEMAKAKNMQHALCNGIWWRYVILDEGHKIKNELSEVSMQMQKMHSYGRLLLTGTPLQNNLHELWALLRYLNADVFDVSEPFDEAFDLTKGFCDNDKLEEAHRLLRVFQLRRIKSEVEKLLSDRHEMKIVVPLSEDQKFWVWSFLASFL
jgi:SNF2 family DNA or RNA helicase